MDNYVKWIRNSNKTINVSFEYLNVFKRDIIEKVLNFQKKGGNIH